MDGTSWTLWWCSQGEWQASRHTLIYIQYKDMHMCSRSTCMNTQTFPQSYENTRSEQEVNSSLLSATLACACACVCYSRVLSLLRCPNEWPHPGQGSSQITGQNCRQPAAWVANKCHYNFYKEEGAPKGTDTG